MNRSNKNINKESGAALIVSLVMLVVLTVLAISTMRGASMEVAMTSNAQFAENAFQLAETGIESFIAEAIDDPDCIDTAQPGLCNIGSTPITGMKGTFQAQDVFVNAIPNCPNRSSRGTFAAYHFEIQATGQTVDQTRQGGASQHNQGWWVCRNN